MENATGNFKAKFLKLINKSLIIGVIIGIIIGKPLYNLWDDLYYKYYLKEQYVSELKNDLTAPPINKIEDTSKAEEKIYENWEIMDSLGRVLSSDDDKGKVLFLNFWASWCVPCLAEMPSIQKLYETIKDEKFKMLCLSKEDLSVTNDFQKKNGYTFPIYSIDDDPPIPSQFESRGIPATFIISKNRKIAFKHVGSAKWDDSKCIEFIQNLLKEQ